MDDDLIPYGYVACRCGAWILSGRTQCDDCLADVGRAADEAVVIDIDGAGVTIGSVKRPKKKRRAKADNGGPRSDETRARDRARTRAWIRLAQIYEPMFVALYVEEQLREGLDPVDPPPMKADVFDVLARDIAEFRSRQEATLELRDPTLSPERPAQPA